MAGIVAHLVIAREIIKRLPKNTIKNEALFYAGSIAPDAIHAREGFVRADKKHTHLRDDIPDKDFTQCEYLSLFHNRVAKFIEEHREREDGFLDLYRGYVVHLLTDELYLLTIRQEFVECMEQQGIVQSDKAFFTNIMMDLNLNDFQLISRYPEIEEVRNQLEKVQPFELEDLFSEKELTNSKNWAIQRLCGANNDPTEPIYTSYERTLEFIMMSAQDIIERLSEGGSLPTMF